MKRIFIALIVNFLIVTVSYAASWKALQDNKHADLVLDQQSITESGKYQKAWVKLNYKEMQTNIQYPEKRYNNAKMLWYFDCAVQKSATAQVYQLLNDELVYSAAIDIKRARFIEPVPETEIDIAMQYVCQRKAYQEEAKAKAAEAKQKHENALENESQTKVTGDQAKETTNSAEKPVEIAKEAKPEPSDKEDNSKATDEAHDESKKVDAASEKDKLDDEKHAEKIDKKDNKKEHDEHVESDKKKTSDSSKKKKNIRWGYKGKIDPEHWGDLSPDYISCKVGSNQSPIDIDKTIVTLQKPLKTFQRFPAFEVSNNGQSVEVSFKPGNIMVIDSVMYQMDNVTFHGPSEHLVKGKSYSFEAHFLHTDPKGNMAVLAVMFDEGPENKAITKLLENAPRAKAKPKKITTKVLASELIPREKSYYRYSGSLTVPPCSEGVVWIVMKSTMTASASQINAYKKLLGHDNNRPQQPLNGRMVIE